MQLLLFRHAEAEPRNDGGDLARRLAPEGREHALRVGRLLASRRLVPDLVVTSHAERARATWESAAQAFGARPPPTLVDESLWREEAAEHAAAVARHGPGHQCLMLVGHEPGLSRYTKELVGRPVGLRRGTVAVLRLPSWNGAGAELVEILDG